MQTIYAYRHPPKEPCSFQWFSLEQLQHARCPKCWWWTVMAPEVVPDNDPVVSYVADDELAHAAKVAATIEQLEATIEQLEATTPVERGG